MRRIILLLLVLISLASLLMAFSPGYFDGEIESGEKKNPYPDEINYGEPGMEKIFFYPSPNLVSGNFIIPTKETAFYYPSYDYFFIKQDCRGCVWFFWSDDSAEVPVKALCHWRYIYD